MNAVQNEQEYAIENNKREDFGRGTMNSFMDTVFCLFHLCFSFDLNIFFSILAFFISFLYFVFYGNLFAGVSANQSI